MPVRSWGISAWISKPSLRQFGHARVDGAHFVQFGHVDVRLVAVLALHGIRCRAFLGLQLATHSCLLFLEELVECHASAQPVLLAAEQDMNHRQLAGFGIRSLRMGSQADPAPLQAPAVTPPWPRAYSRAAAFPPPGSAARLPDGRRRPKVPFPAVGLSSLLRSGRNTCPSWTARGTGAVARHTRARWPPTGTSGGRRRRGGACGCANRRRRHRS